ncbi:MAG: hypothetical protein BWY04_00077 [candidate division CPR1 bacterium ADurb.Bin160]|uniref:Uncharacterized protein n=1 Tax=candidate division CPR1 bacterium ADurb.Bin160 TaxID=1852826 RepID=A0A1V5ZRD7_9BACT|nr:MAG: hypothetical protein BWY04_00077 [candidate division CPR1 bacterium ADurb.Bin160]
MLIDIVNSYDKEKKEFLLGIWEDVILHLAKQIDPKKIFTFLQKAGIISIDEKEQKVYV